MKQYQTIVIIGNACKTGLSAKALGISNETAVITVDTFKSFGWYYVSVVKALLHSEKDLPGGLKEVSLQRAIRRWEECKIQANRIMAIVILQMRY